jgi:hypothetical protein
MGRLGKTTCTGHPISTHTRPVKKYSNEPKIKSPNIFTTPIIRQWGAGNVNLLVLSSLKANIDKPPIAVMGL